MSKFDIVSTDLLLILSNFVATDAWVLFEKSIKKICNIMFKTNGGGINGFLNNVLRNCGFGSRWHPLLKWKQLLICFHSDKPLSDFL